MKVKEMYSYNGPQDNEVAAHILNTAMWIMNQTSWGELSHTYFNSEEYKHPLSQLQFDDLCMRICTCLDPELLSMDGECTEEEREYRYNALITAGERLNQYAEEIGLTQREIDEDF
jgi:hypothetical protein